MNSIPDDFIKSTTEAVSPLYVECLSSETRKTGHFLLLTESILYALSLSFATVGGLSTVAFEGIQFTVVTGLQRILESVCAYFLLIFGLRSYSEWKWWRLSQQGPVTTFLHLLHDTTNQFDELIKTRINLLAKLREAHTLHSEIPGELQKEFQKIPVNLSEMKRIINLRRSTGQVERPQLMEVDADLIETLENESETIASEIELLKERYSTDVSSGELEENDKQFRFLDLVVRPTKKIFFMRLTLEILFPICFGIGSIVISVLRFGL